MDQMDMNHIVDVPDTPDRLTARKSSKRIGVEEEFHKSSIQCRLGQQKYSKDGTKDQPMVNGSGSKRLFLPQCTTSSSNSACPKRTRGVTEENSSYRSHNSDHTQNKKIERPSCSDKLVDLTERNMHIPVNGNGFRGGVSGSSRGFRERSANGSSCSHGPGNNSTASENSREGTDNMSKVSSAVGYSKGVEFSGNVENKSSNSGIVFRDPITSPTSSKQKKLVRNGCISPNNIAKAKQLSVKDANGSVAVLQNTSSTSTPSCSPVSADIMDLVAEDNDSRTRKGKGVLMQSCSSEEPDFRNKNSVSRSSISFNEKAKESNGCTRGTNKGAEKSSGWVSTHSRQRKMNISSSDDEQFVIMDTNAARCVGQQHENTSGRRKRGRGFATGDAYPMNRSLRSSEISDPQGFRQSESNPRAQTGQLNGLRSATRKLAKRQKRGSMLSSSGECSTSVSDDPEVVLLESHAEPSIPRSILNNLQPVIEIDESSPEFRRDAYDEDARTRQLEADELLARELQEQLYSEGPVLGDAEFDAHFALAMQHQDDDASPRGSRPVANARGSRMPNFHGQSRSRPSVNHPRRGSQSRASGAGRMTRLRNQFHGQPRTLVPSRERTSMFPANMDVDMRMHILGALEAINDMGVGPGFLQNQGDFNENDYEMLLALDENNDQHAGASFHQINGLPQSTVQSDNFDEACAVCLETPTIGDTIRHLPCLHKFHKDCIDPWLRRRTSCPVCKSSIT